MLGLRFCGKLHGHLPELTVIPSGVSRARLMSRDLYSQTVNGKTSVCSYLYCIAHTPRALGQALRACRFYAEATTALV